MVLLGSMTLLMDITDGLYQTMKMSESSFLAQILAYVTENKLIAASKAEAQKVECGNIGANKIHH